MPNQSIYRPIKFRLAMPMMREMIALSVNKELTEVQMKWFNDQAEIEELYDCEKDPFQINNLAYNEDYIIILEEMRKKYRTEWIERYNAEWELYPESYFVEKMWKNGNKPKCEEPKFNISGDYVSIINNPDINSISYRIINLDKKWNIYNVPVKLNHGDEMEIIIERIGYEPSKKFITNI